MFDRRGVKKDLLDCEENKKKSGSPLLRANAKKKKVLSLMSVRPSAPFRPSARFFLSLQISIDPIRG